MALVRVGEASGTLDHLLESWRPNVKAAKRFDENSARQCDIRPFILFASRCVLTFFSLFVLPQFASVLRGFQAKLDPIVGFFLGLSDLVRLHGDVIAVGSVIPLMSAWLLAVRPDVQRATWNTMMHLLS